MLKDFEDMFKSKQFNDLLEKLNEEEKKATLDYIKQIVDNFEKQITGLKK